MLKGLLEAVSRLAALWSDFAMMVVVVHRDAEHMREFLYGEFRGSGTDAFSTGMASGLGHSSLLEAYSLGSRSTHVS